MANFILSKISRLIIIILLVLSNKTVNAQALIHGLIIDNETREPVFGALVKSENTFHMAVSDEKGMFSISFPSDKKTQLIISHISYQTKYQSVTGNEMKVELSRKAYLSEEVSVTSLRIDNKSSFAFSEIDKEEIENKNHGKDIPFLLNSTPSSVATSDAGTGIGYTGLRIRGSDATRINVTINGIPVNDAESHQVYWVDLPDFASSVENIQIQRGIGSSTNGAGSFGGSINILTKKVSPDAFGTVNSSVGSFNTFKNTLMFGSGLIENQFAFEGRLSMINSDGYIDRSSSALRSYFFSGGYYGKKNSLRFITFSGKEKTYQAWYGVPEDSLFTNRTYNPAGEYYDNSGTWRVHNNQTDNYQQDYYQLIFTHEFNKNLSSTLGLHYTKGKGYFEEYRPDEFLNSYHLPEIIIGDSTITNSDLITQLWLSNHFYGAVYSLDYENKKIKVKAGIAANKYDGIHYGELIAAEVMVLQQYPWRYYKNDAQKTDLSFFIRADYEISSSLNVIADVQVRSIEYSFFGFNDEFLNSKQNQRMIFFNPKAGLHYELNQRFKIYGSVSTGHKEPVRDDFVYSIPENRPDAEKMIDYETGVGYRSANVLLGLNLFYMNYKNQLILTGKKNDVGEDIRESVKNSYRSGIEGEAMFKISSQFNFQMNATISNNKIKLYNEYVIDYDGGAQIKNEYNNTSISFSPKLTGYAQLSYNYKKAFTIDLTGKYVGQQYLDNTMNDQRKLDSYFVNDLRLAYFIRKIKLKEISFRFSLYNLLNKEYVSNGAVYSGYSNGARIDSNYFYPQARLHWLAGITMKF